MRIHLIQPNDLNHQSLMTGKVILSEGYLNHLLSYEYRKFEPAYRRIWDSFIDIINETRNL